MRAEIIAIGSELVSGQSLDTNSQWLSSQLSSLGIPTVVHTTISDELDLHVSAFKIAAGRADLVIMTGGLGPTQDDLTREAMAATAGVGLFLDPGSLAAIEAFFSRRSRPMAERNKVQAMFPEGAEPLPNPVGTAPGICMVVGRSIFFCLPGIPSEMRVMFHEQVVPRLRARNLIQRVILFRKINLFGRGESDIEAKAMDLTARGREPEVGITAHEATISFRIRGEGATQEEALLQTEPTARTIHERFGTLVIGEGAVDVPEAVFEQLQQKGVTLATAESCTGGLVAQMITALAGVSPFYRGGVVSYSNEAKTTLLGVPDDLIRKHGAVSPEVAEAMAAGARLRLGADIAVSTT
ncbi:MAG TPA: CinA family nicotinamide mononucleotide deamidase-related protein, partial [Isosphaeraceae bacterium]|nr:CinA family nicotinamide mononucleotide deamidase-related protein [Isosphaeraceae bacterium]